MPVAVAGRSRLHAVVVALPQQGNKEGYADDRRDNPHRQFRRCDDHAGKGVRHHQQYRAGKESLLGFFVWGDVPGPNVWLGSIILIFAGLYILYRETRRQPTVSPSNP